MAVCPYRGRRGGAESPGLCTLSKPLQRGEWNRLLWALFILCSCSQSIWGSKGEMREVSQSSPTHHCLSRHLVQSEWQQTGGGQNSRGSAPQETSWSKGDNHGTCQGLIWTTRTQTFRGIYEGWHRGGQQCIFKTWRGSTSSPLRVGRISLWNRTYSRLIDMPLHSPRTVVCFVIKTPTRFFKSFFFPPPFASNLSEPRRCGVAITLRFAADLNL